MCYVSAYILWFLRDAFWMCLVFVIGSCGYSSLNVFYKPLTFILCGVFVELSQHHVEQCFAEPLQCRHGVRQPSCKKFWTLLSEKTRDGIKSGADGRPCDKQFDACFNSPEFLNLLQHRFGPSNSSAALKTNDQEEPKLKKVKVVPPKGAGKASSFMRIPNDLLAVGCVGQTSKGHRLCFDYN